jgi:3-dehydroquinate dehydratase-2
MRRGHRERAAAMSLIYVLNGPNLNLLGEREPDVYGYTTLAEIHANCENRAAELGLDIDFRQTNFEGELIESVHEARRKAAGIVINPAGYTFTSIALLDSLKMFDGPKIELHISNVHTRESIYHHSLVSRAATGLIIGFGAYGYEMALDAMHHLLGAA